METKNHYQHTGGEWMATILNHIGTAFLGAAVFAFAFLFLLASRDDETRVLEVFLIAAISAVPASVALFFFVAARQLAA